MRASTELADINVTVSDLPDGVAVASYQWYVKESSTGTPMAISDDSGKTRELTIADVTEAEEPDGVGVQYYVVVTGSDKKEYKSGLVTLEEPVATSLSVTSFNPTYGTALSTSNTSDILDQFGVKMTAGDYSFSTTGTGTTVASDTEGAAKIGFSEASEEVTVKTSATTAAGEYKVKVYNLAGNETIDAEKLVGEITVTVGAKTAVYGATAASNDFTATLTAAAASGTAEKITIADKTSVDGEITAADIESITVSTAEGNVEGNVAGLVWTASESDAKSQTAQTVTIVFKGNYKGTLTLYVVSGDADGKILSTTTADGGRPQ